MIKLCDREVNISHFPDSTQLIKLDNTWEFDFAMDLSINCWIEWKYESDEELVSLIYLVNHLRDKLDVTEISLKMKYLPNSRMDRTVNKEEVFTLKYFCGIINSLNFKRVLVLDVHSSVSIALLDRVIEINPIEYIEEAIQRVENEEDFNYDLVLFFPDAGSMKRYSKMIKEVTDLPYCHGEKERDWETGELKHEIKIVNDFNIDLVGRPILMIDDIIAYGGTMINSAKALKEQGVGNIYAYATHVENSILSTERPTLASDKNVKMIYTTDSLYSGTHEKIKVID